MVVVDVHMCMGPFMAIVVVIATISLPLCLSLEKREMRKVDANERRTNFAIRRTLPRGNYDPNF